MAVVQVPPAPGSSGQQIDVFQLSAASTTFREIVAIGSAFTSSGLAVVTTSGGLQVNVSSGTVTLSSMPALSSGVVTLSSVHTVTATAGTNPWSSAPGFNVPIVSASSGLIQIAGSVTATAATNPWSSAPSFSVPVVSASSGLIQISGTPTVVSASSGLVQISGTPTITIVGTSGAIAPATSSGGLGVSILSGAGAGSTAINIVGSSGAASPVTSSGGLLVQITNPLLSSGTVSVSSGFITITSGLITLSSAITVYNVTNTVSVVSASSGMVQISPQTSDALECFGYVSSSSANATLITGVPAAYYGYSAFNTTGSLRFVHIYMTSSAPGIGTTANWKMSFMVPYSTAGGAGLNLVNPVPLAYSTKGLGFTITNGISSTSTGTVGAQDVLLTIFYKA